MAELNFQDFIASNPNRQALLQRGLRGQSTGSQPFLDSARRTQVGLGNNLGGFGAQGLPLGLSTLNEILLGQGKTDPRARNRALVNVGRNTEAQQVQNRQGAAQRGLQNSGVTSAIDAAIGASGADRAAAVETDFIEKEEKRKRDDLLLMLQVLINPSLQQSSIAAGLSGQNAAADAAQQQAQAQALASIVAAMCWVARSVYGKDNPKWLMARHYVLNIAPSWFRNLYLRYGEAFAGWLDGHAWAKRFVRPAFDYMVSRASRELVVA